jgi:1-acyl-sn-glycerol-3-phosphate acyltransferase
MKGILKAVQVVYSIYSWIVLAIMIILAFFVMLIITPFIYKKPEKAIYWLGKTMVQSWGLFTGVFFRLKGQEKISTGESFVVTANHTSFLDLPLLAHMPIRTRTLSKVEILRIPFFGQLLRMGMITVDRSNPESRKASIEAMSKKVKDGVSIFIFPEGTRNRTDQPLRPFKTGAFRVAIQHQLPIVPAIITNSRNIQPATTWLCKPGTVTMEFCDPIPTKGLTEEDMPALMEKIYRFMEAKILELEPAFQKQTP